MSDRTAPQASFSRPDGRVIDPALNGSTRNKLFCRTCLALRIVLPEPGLLRL